MKNIHRDVIKAKQVRLNHVWAPIVCRPQWKPATWQFLCVFRLSASGVNLRAELDDPFQTSRDHPLASTPREINSMKINFISRSSRSYWKICFRMGLRRSAKWEVEVGTILIWFWRKNIFLGLQTLKVSRLVKRCCSINVFKLLAVNGVVDCSVWFAACGRN